MNNNHPSIKQVLVAALLLFGICAMPGQGLFGATLCWPGTTVDVNPGDNIQTAINTAQLNAGTVRIHAGTYNVSSLSINKPVRLLGDGPATTIINITGTITVSYSYGDILECTGLKFVGTGSNCCWTIATGTICFKSDYFQYFGSYGFMKSEGGILDGVVSNCVIDRCSAAPYADFLIRGPDTQVNFDIPTVSQSSAITAVVGPHSTLTNALFFEDCIFHLENGYGPVAGVGGGSRIVYRRNEFYQYGLVDKILEAHGDQLSSTVGTRLTICYDNLFDGTATNNDWQQGLLLLGGTAIIENNRFVNVYTCATLATIEPGSDNSSTYLRAFFNGNTRDGSPMDAGGNGIEQTYTGGTYTHGYAPEAPTGIQYVLPDPHPLLVSCQPAGALQVSNYDLMPASVSTGQQDLYAVMFTINNPSADTALIKGVTLTVRDSLSAGVIASSAMSMLGIRDEVSYYYNAAAPVSPNVFCPVPAGILVGPYSSKNIYAVADITGNTIARAQEFSIEISSAAGIRAEDILTGNTLPVSASAGYVFPIGSSVAVIQNRATELTLTHIDTMPASVSTGQVNVKAMGLVMNDIGNTMTASIKVSRVSIEARDAAGNPIASQNAFKKIKITSADGAFVYGESAASGSSKLTILLTAPLIVPSTQAFTCTVRVDVSDTLAASAGRVSLNLGNDIYAVDANSSEPVIVTSISPFPKQSGAAVIQERVSDINLDNFTALLPPGVVKGQKWVEIFDFRIYDTLGPQSAQAYFNSLTITVKNSLGAAAPSNASVEKFYITDNAGNTLGSALTGVGSETYIALSSPHVFTSGLARYFRLFADILPTAYAPNFKVALQAAGNISITDANSGYEAAKIAAPPLPWETGSAGIFIAPATDLKAWHNGNVAPTMAGMGQPDVKFMTLHAFNPGYIGTADIMIKGLTLTVVDAGNSLIAPSTVLENVHVTNIAGDIIHANYYAVSATAAAPFYVDFSTPIFVDALNTKNAYISGDIALNAAQGVYRVRISAAGDYDRLSVPAGYVTATAANADSFPMDSNPVTITALAYNFKAGHRDLMPVSVAEGSLGVIALSINFENYNVVPIEVTSLAVSVRNCAGELIAANSVISAITILDRDNNTIAAATPGASGRINISTFSFNVPSGAEKEMKFSVDLLSAASVPFYMELESGSDVSTLPLAGVNPADGDFFGNMKSGCVSIQQKSFEKSFHAFPNPFDPRAGPAYIEYYAEKDSRVTIKIYTMNGELVRVIADNLVKFSGLHHEDYWPGTNAAGRDVKSGVYLCVIEAVPSDGSPAVKLKCKVVVLR